MRLLRWWFVLRQRIRTLVRPIAVERELDRELRYHLEREIQENLSRNMPPDEARRAALRSLDGLTTIQEECRDMRHVNHFENLFQDLRYALRAMGRNPGFTAGAGPGGSARTRGSAWGSALQPRAKHAILRR
jgi:hypothetical protein